MNVMWTTAMKLRAANARIVQMGRTIAQLREELNQALTDRDRYASQLEAAVRRGFNLESRLEELVAEAASLRESIDALDRFHDQRRRDAEAARFAAVLADES